MVNSRERASRLNALRVPDLLLHLIPTRIFPNDGLHNDREQWTAGGSLGDVESLCAAVHSEAEGCQVIASICSGGDQSSNIEIG